MELRYELSSPLSAAPVDKVPTAPVAVILSLVGANTPRVQVTPPARSGGPIVGNYTIQWDVTSTLTGGSPLANTEIVSTSQWLKLVKEGVASPRCNRVATGEVYYFEFLRWIASVKGSNTVYPCIFGADVHPWYQLMCMWRRRKSGNTNRSVTVTWTAPTSNQGSSLSGYLVEWYARTSKEVQTIETAVVDSGSFTSGSDGTSFGLVAHDRLQQYSLKDNHDSSLFNNYCKQCHSW